MRRIMSYTRSVKILLIVGFFLLFLTSLIMAQTPPVIGYELSIYDAFPISVWIFLILSLFIGICLITLYPLHKCDSSLKYAIILIVLSTCIVLLLPLIRGYFLAYDPNYDTLYHIGEAKYISNTGHFMAEDWYPIIHILISILHSILYFFNLSYENITLLLSSLYSIAFFLFAIPLSKCITKSYYERSLVICCASPLFFQIWHSIPMPFYCSLWTIPLLLYLLHLIKLSKQKYSFELVAIILFANIIFFHPLTTVFVILIIVITIVLEKFNMENTKVTSQYLYIIIFIFILALFWLINNITFGNFVFNTYHQYIDIFISNSGKNPNLINHQINLVISSEADLIFILDRTIKIYGSIIIYTVANLFLISLYTTKKILNRKIQYFELLYLLLFVLGLLLMTVLTSGIIVGEIHRAASLLLVINPFLLGIEVYSVYKNQNTLIRYLIILLITGIICSTAFLSIFAIYPSPWDSGINTMTTFQEKNCLEWFSDCRNNNIPLISEYLQTRCWNNYYYGAKNTEKNIYRYNFKIPTHFGYIDNSRFGNLLDTKPAYLITNDKMRQYYNAAPESRRYKLSQFNNSDFEKLNRDSSVEKIYSTKGCETWLVR